MQASIPPKINLAGDGPRSTNSLMTYPSKEDWEALSFSNTNPDFAPMGTQRTQADLRFIGLIGSQTKWATFRKRLQARGFTNAELAQVTSPIGVPGIPGKAPEVIAVAVAAQLLQLGD